MNNAPKRSLEETSSKHPHQNSGVLSLVSLDCHAAHEIGQDSPRAAKTLCLEGRDADRRSPLHSVYPVPLSSNDSQADHHIVTQKKDLYGESEKDGRLDKGTKNERDSRIETKGDSKKEKNTYGLVSSSPFNWKDSREYRGKRYKDSPDVSLDSRSISCEAGKENPTAEKRDCLEDHEAVKENKIDSKSEDRFKDRNSNKDGSDHRNSRQVNNSIGENKKSSKEDQDAEKWEREDIPNNKEKSAEREKDHIKKEPRNGMEKEVLYIDKDASDYVDDRLRRTGDFEPRMTQYQSQSLESSDSSNHTDLEEEKCVELSNWMDVSGNEKKGRVFSDGVLSSNLKERPSGFMQKSSSVSTTRSHPEHPFLVEMRRHLPSQEEQVQQAVQKAVEVVTRKGAEERLELKIKLDAKACNMMERIMNERPNLLKRMEEMENQLQMQQMPTPSYYQQQIPPPPSPFYYQHYQQQMPPPPLPPPRYYQQYHQQHYYRPGMTDYRPDMTQSSLHHYHLSRMSLQPPTQLLAQPLTQSSGHFHLQPPALG